LLSAPPAQDQQAARKVRSGAEDFIFLKCSAGTQKAGPALRPGQIE
jgi:hypothetical protein